MAIFPAKFKKQWMMYAHQPPTSSYWPYKLHVCLIAQIIQVLHLNSYANAWIFCSASSDMATVHCFKWLATYIIINCFIKLYAFQLFIMINSRIAMRNLLWMTSKQNYCISLDQPKINYTHTCASLINLFTMINPLKKIWTNINIEWGMYWVI